MARIPLRSYHREIENLIERGQIEEAIAHSKNILKQFPKNIETYRLLGKAYLESQRYSEASDILQRLLSVVPDDFVSQLGMSVIREDEGNLDASIWHMERAYEVQPFNRAIQDELRRLYGRRDGSEPPRIRLTRGSLVRMYARGDLYSQAIAESRAALAEDHERLDLRVLLAQMYYLSGQKVEAAEIASSLIGKLPYCLEANRILMEILPSTSRAEEARVFQHRVYDLDPYVEFVTPNTPTSAQVPEQAVMVERVDWQPTMQESQSPDWTRTIGVKWEADKEENLPEWLNSFGTSPETPSAIAIIPAQQHEIIPDFMREAGWSPSEHPGAEQPPPAGTADEPDPSAGEEDLEQVDIPDWLKEMAPKSIQTGPEADDNSLDWINNIIPAAGVAFTSPDISPEKTQEAEESISPMGVVDSSNQGLPDDVDLQDIFQKDEEPSSSPDLIAALQQSPGVAGVDSDDETLDWLKDFGSLDQTQPASETQAVPDQANLAQEEAPAWLKLGEPTAKEDLSWLQPEQAAGEQVSEEVPAWLGKDDQENPAPADEIPAWLNESPPPAPTDQPVVNQAEWINEPIMNEAQGVLATEETSSDELTDWLKDLKIEDEEPQPGAQPPAVEPTLEEEIPDWLKPLPESGDEPAVSIPGESVPTPISDEAPSWMTEPVSEVAAPLGVEEPPQPEAAVTNPQEMDLDSAMAWLEGLAAKQGADEDSLKITSPEQRTETPPDWIAGYTQAGSVDESVKPIKAAEEVIPAWVTAESNAEPETPVETAVAQTPTKELPLADNDIPSQAPKLIPSGLLEPVADVSALIEVSQAVDQQPESVFPPEPVEPAAEEKTQPLAVRKPAEPVEEPLEPPVSSQPNLDDIDSAMAWMEALAAKQGADADSLKITAVEERSETPPDWIASLSQAEPESVEPVAAVPEPAQPAEEPEIPAWMQEEEPGAQAQEPVLSTAVNDLPEWLKDLDESETPAAVIEPVVSEPVQKTEEVEASTWIQEEEPAVAAQEPRTSPITELPDWLKGLDVEEEPEEAVVEAAQPSATVDDTIPDWLAEPEPDSGPTAPTSTWTAEPEPSIEMPPPLAESVPSPEAVAAPNLDDMDSAMAWLEALASKQGADADSLKITSVEQRSETAPDWITELAKTQTEPAPVVAQAPVEEPSSPIQEPQAAPVEPVLAELKPETPPEAPISPQVETRPQAQETAETEIPFWLLNYEQEQNQITNTWETIETVHPEPVQTSAADDSITVWLQRHHPDTGELKTPAVEDGTPAQEKPPEAAPVSEIQDSALSAAQAAIQRGESEAAAQFYSEVIKSGENLDIVVNDLREALKRNPSEVDLWQTLGDAHIRANRIQDALDAYTQAEELLR